MSTPEQLPDTQTLARNKIIGRVVEGAKHPLFERYFALLNDLYPWHGSGPEYDELARLRKEIFGDLVADK